MTETPRVKVGLALFVRNEIDDIASWVAWHFAIGVDTLFIYDDHSSDGTYEVLAEAAAVARAEGRSIVLARTDRRAEPTVDGRRREAYFDACRRARGALEWLGFLDSDELLALEPGLGLAAFFASLGDASAVALNWCIYGSNGAAIRSRIPLYAFFQTHASAEMDDNRLAKSFIRPERYTFTYNDPHRFTVAPDRYVDALARPVRWEGTCTPVTWQRARINHYVVRSMEDYVARIRLRRDVAPGDTSHAFRYFDRNECHTAPDPAICARADEVLASIRERCLDSFIAAARQSVPPGASPLGSNAAPQAATVYRIVSREGCVLDLGAPDGRVIQTAAGAAERVALRGIRYASDPDVLYLARIVGGHVANVPFHLAGDLRHDYATTFRLIRPGGVVATDAGAGDAVVVEAGLQSPVTDRFVCCVPMSAGGAVECNRAVLSRWETCRLEPDVAVSIRTAASPAAVSDLLDFFAFLQNDAVVPSHDDVLLAASGLSEADRRRIRSFEGGELIAWIF